MAARLRAALRSAAALAGEFSRADAVAAGGTASAALRSRGSCCA